MGQAQNVHRKVTFDAGHFLARIISLFLGRIRVLHTLGVEDQESGVTFSLGASANFAHPIFLKRTPEDYPGLCLPPIFDKRILLTKKWVREASDEATL